MQRWKVGRGFRSETIASCIFRKRPSNLLRILMKHASVVMFVALILVGTAAAESKQVVSNSTLFLESSLIDDDSGEEVVLIGLLHVQTKSDGARTMVHANVRENLFIGYSLVSTDPAHEELKALREEIHALRVLIVQLTITLQELEVEYIDTLNTDTDPIRPGIQPDTERLKQLKRQLEEVYQSLKRVQEELQKRMDRIAEIVREIDQQAPEMITEYQAFGADAVASRNCTEELLCESLVHLDLIREDGVALPFAVRLLLQFSNNGELISGDADLEDEMTDSDSDLIDCNCGP